MEELKPWIENILPIEGEWWGSGAEKFCNAAEKMLKAGMSVQNTKDILRDLYIAVSGEYGN